ncbi:MAG TPA: hypothetical protein VGP99_03250 [Tepidisphaeraceae bacterium]|jgi:hypothetical protein|nr:hypothetical protein [Tepidisphaeraceae bacterium]
MNVSASSLDRFIRRVYRRLVVLRLVEWAGLGFGIGCGLALLLIILLRNRSESPLALAAVVMTIGAALGFVACVLRRPKMIDAAVEADRQLELADLLATAWQLKKTPQKESFEEAVLLIANDRAAHIQPRSVVLHRLGVRAWSGIGLAGALVLTVAILTANPLDTQASSSPFLPQAGSDKTQQDSKTSRSTDIASGRRPTAIAQDHPGGEDDPLPGAGKTTDVTTNAARGQNTDVQNSNPNGTGSGAGQSVSRPDRRNSLPSGTNSTGTNKNGTSSSGVGNSSEGGNTSSGNTSSTSAGNSTKSPSAPAWKSDSWPAAQQAADSAISTGQIPPAYHDLVREYFKR